MLTIEDIKLIKKLLEDNKVESKLLEKINKILEFDEVQIWYDEKRKEFSKYIQEYTNED